MKLREWWRINKVRIAPPLILGFVRILAGTVRIQCVNGTPEDDWGKSLLCGWHGQSLLFAHAFRNRGFWVIISNSNDGDIQNAVFSALGYQSIRGSTGRGGVRAALQAVKVLKDYGCMAITPDGPRGPHRVVQGGVMLMAQKSGARLVPVGVAACPKWLAPSWDHYLVPMPFGRGVIFFGESLTVPSDASEEQVESIRLEFEAAINRAQAEADRLAKKRKKLN